MQFLKIIGAFFLLIVAIFSLIYVYPVLKSFNLSDVTILGIFALLPVFVRIAFLSFKFYRNPPSQSTSLISLIVDDLIILINGFLPLAIVIALSFAFAFPDIRQNVLIMIPLIAIPLRFLFYRKRESEWVSIGSLMMDDLILFSIFILPFIIILALIVSVESPEIQEEMYQFSSVSVIFILVMFFISARRRRAQSRIFITEDYIQWRVNLLNTKAEEAGISSDSPGTVYGVFVDLSIKLNKHAGNKNVVLSTATFANGHIFMNLSSSHRSIDTTTHDGLARLAKEIVDHANTCTEYTRPVSEAKLPPAGHILINIYFLSTSGILFLNPDHLPENNTYAESVEYIGSQVNQIHELVAPQLKQEPIDLDQELMKHTLL